MAGPFEFRSAGTLRLRLLAAPLLGTLGQPAPKVGVSFVLGGSTAWGALGVSVGVP